MGLPKSDGAGGIGALVSYKFCEAEKVEKTCQRNSPVWWHEVDRLRGVALGAISMAKLTQVVSTWKNKRLCNKTRSDLVS